MTTKIAAILKGFLPSLVLFACGLTLGWSLYRCRPGPPEPPAPAIHQKDGSLILERSSTGKPADQPHAAPLKPAGGIPKGAKIERNIEVIVQPRPERAPVAPEAQAEGILEAPAPRNLSDAFQCPEVKVDLSLVRMKDKAQRVIASSPDGKVIGGLDVPVSETPFPKPQRWTAEAMTGYDVHLAHQVFGGQVSRNLGPFTVSAGAIGSTAFVGAGIHF